MSTHYGRFIINGVSYATDFSKYGHTIYFMSGVNWRVLRYDLYPNIYIALELWYKNGEQYADMSLVEFLSKTCTDWPSYQALHS
jgi:hypothetical protein